MSTFPSNAIVRVLCFVDAGLTTGAEHIVIADLAPFLFIEEALCHSAYGIYIVTYLTVRSTQLQVVQPLLSVLHERFITDAPT